MESKSKAFLAILAIAAIASFGVALTTIPLSAHAVPNGATTSTCIHNGNGGDKCTPGESSTTVTCTKEQGKFVCSSSR